MLCLHRSVFQILSSYNIFSPHSVKIGQFVTTHFLILYLLSYPSTEAGFLNIITASSLPIVLLVILNFFRSKDEDFYSNLAATAEDDLSDVSEADVNQMARSLQVSV